MGSAGHCAVAGENNTLWSLLLPLERYSIMQRNHIKLSVALLLLLVLKSCRNSCFKYY